MVILCNEYVGENTIQPKESGVLKNRMEKHDKLSDNF